MAEAMVLIAALVLGATPLAVPFVPQKKDSCGAAALTMVLHYWHVAADHDQIASELLSPQLHGIRGSALEAFARARGLTAVAHEGDLDQLREYVAKRRPMIVSLDAGRGRFHDLVVVGFEAQWVIVHDPAEGASRRIAARDFETRWARAGHFALLVLPGSPPQP
jgi:ABC-type bacteriocin/lantibiotic exporter with double-glycine peptidase domain